MDAKGCFLPCQKDWRDGFKESTIAKPNPIRKLNIEGGKGS